MGSPVRIYAAISASESSRNVTSVPTTCVFVSPPAKTLRPVKTVCVRPERSRSMFAASSSFFGFPRIFPSITTIVSAETMISSGCSRAIFSAFLADTAATSCSGVWLLSIVSSMSAVCTVNSSPIIESSCFLRGDFDARMIMFFLSLGSTAQFGKQIRREIFCQGKVRKTKEYCMYFSFFEPKYWQKRSVEVRRRNCAVLPLFHAAVVKSARTAARLKACARAVLR